MSVSAASSTVLLGATDAITATVTGSTNATVTWSVGNVTGGNSTVGTISAAGNYTAPGVLPQPATETITATSAADTTKSASVTLTIVSNFTVAITGPATVAAGSSATYQATLTPAPGSNPNTTINWSVSGPGCTGATCGVISPGGVYQAPVSAPSPNSVILTATPLADPSKAATLIVTIQPNVQVTISPNVRERSPGRLNEFSGERDRLGEHGGDMGREWHRRRQRERRHDRGVNDESESSHIHRPASIAAGRQRKCAG